MNINDQMALLGYAQMLDDTVSVPGMKGGEPVRILMNEIQRLTAELAARDAARVPEIGPLLLERIEVRTKGYVEMAAMLNDWIRANTIPPLRAPVAKEGGAP